MRYLTLLLCCTLLAPFAGAEEKTYAERLGWPKGSKVVIFHSDDMGMCWEANEGTRIAMEEGLVTSASVMMPAPWVMDWMNYLEENPHVDSGIHLTHTSEWDTYRWGPLAGVAQVPGLADKTGSLWDGVGQVIENGSADEVEAEIRAQIARAERMGMPVTHMDSHMGTLFSNMEFFKRYVKVGVEKQIPILITGPNGHLQKKYESGAAELFKVFDVEKEVWDKGLPVLDDATGVTYGWKTFEEKKRMMLKTIRELKPGVTEIIVHATKVTPNFDRISTSGSTRQADMDVMLDEDVKKAIEEEGIILTTWRELKERRDKVGNEN
jgi:hypothetical protein